MATTTNYNWATPDDTDLVKDGAAAIRTLGSSADTTVKNLNPGTTAGDIDYYTSSTAKARIGIGTAGQVLRVNAGATAPEWATTADQTPLTTKGDLFTFNTADARLGVGANGTVLTADSAEATGLKWAAPAAGGLTLLSTTTLTGASVTLSAISGSYTNLQLVVKNAYGSAQDWIFLRFNSDTGSNYYRRLSTVAGTSNAAGTTAQTSHLWTQVPSASSDAQNGSGVATLYDYTVTTGQQIVISNGFGFDGTNLFGAWNNGVYDKSAAITSITVGVASGTFSGGTVLLYGVN